MNLTLLLVAILMLPFFFLLQARRKATSQKTARLPSPPRLPFIGNLHQMGTTPHRSLYNLSKEHGPLMLLHLGNVRTLVVSSPKIAEEVIRNNDLVFADRPVSKLTDMLSYRRNDIAFSPYGEGWRQMKRIGMTNLLSSKRVRSLSSDRTAEVSLLLERVADEASRGSGVVCLTQILNAYVTDVIARVVLGSWVTKENKKILSEQAHESSSLFYEVAVGDFFPWLKWLDVVSGLNKKFENHAKKWDALFEEIFRQHSNESKEAKGEKSGYFVDLLLELQKDSSLGFDLTDDNVRGTTMDMMIAGIDTTFTALDWCMTELIRNPDAMKKAKEEVRKTANGEALITEEQLAQMSYLKAFIKEVFRVHPPSPLLVPRESLKECQIQGYTIPKKTRLLFNAWAFGRDESYWEAPGEFRPERFFDSAVDFRGKDFCFIPFGVGRRICPGLNFAMAIIEHALANLLLRFDWSLPCGVAVEDMGMDDSGGIIASRKEKLELVAMACKVVLMVQLMFFWEVGPSFRPLSHIVDLAERLTQMRGPRQTYAPARLSLFQVGDFCGD